MIACRRFAVCSLLGLLLLPSLATAQTFTFDRTYPAGITPALDVSNGRGKIVVVGSDENEIVVQGTSTVRSGLNVPINASQLARAAANKPPVSLVGARLQIREPSDPMMRAAVTLAYEIRLPARTSVTIATTSGAVTVQRVTGGLSVRTTSAAIALSNNGGQTTIDTGSGDVSVRDQAGAITVTTKSSAIVATGLASTFTARTGSGEVTATFSGRGDADVQTASSAITINGLDGGLRTTTNSGRVRVSGAPRTPWTINTGSGEVHLLLGGDSSADVAATTGGGEVKLSTGLVTGAIEKRRVKGTINGGGPAITVTSRSATINIEGR